MYAARHPGPSTRGRAAGRLRIAPQGACSCPAKKALNAGNIKSQESAVPASSSQSWIMRPDSVHRATQRLALPGNDAQPSAKTAAAMSAAAMSAGEAACTAMSADEAGLTAGPMGDEGGPAASTVGNYWPMAIVPAVVMVVHPMIVPVAIVASFMVAIAAHKPERVQVAVVTVIGVAVVAVAVRVIGPGPCTSRQGDTDAKHQAWSKQKLPALRDTHDNLTITRVQHSLRGDAIATGKW